MGVNVLLSGAIGDSLAAIHPGVQDNIWRITFPFSNQTFDTSGFKGGSDATRSHTAFVKPYNTTPGTIVQGFAGDWYNRIHVTPINVDVGNLLTVQTRNILVWNAFTEPKTLASIMEAGDSGMELIQPEVAPVVFSPLEVLTYQLRVGTNGPPVVTGSYQFNFGFVVIEMTARGNRVAVWPFMPQHGVMEALEWKTDVIRTKASEQRIALRAYPRQSFTYDHFMDDREVARARALAVGWANRQFGVPVWTEATFIGDVAEGAPSVAFNTASADYRVGDMVILWSNSADFEGVGVASISAGEIVFKLPVSRAMSNVYIAPMRYARASAFDLSRGAHKLIKVKADFNVTLDKYLGASANLPQHENLDVLTDMMYLVGACDERIEKVVNLIDNGFGEVVSDSVYTTTDQTFTVSWSFTKRSELWRVRAWLHSLKGKQKAFWLPSKANDFQLVLDASSASTAINVLSIEYPLYYTTRAIQITRKNGVKTFHSVTGGGTENGADVLSLSAALGVTTNIADVDSISMMHKVRLDSDRVEISHEQGGYVTIKVPVKEVSK